jgi:Flp pilus assembly protein TadG
MRRTLSIRRNRAALRILLRRFAKGRQGLAAIEFAFILPILLTMYFGLVEVGQGVMADRKVTALTRALADLASQTSTIANTDMSNIFDAAATVMAPFTDANPAMSVSHVVVDDKGVAKVCWSDQRNSTALARGSVVTLPDDLKTPSTSLIMAKSSYVYTPALGYVLTGPLTIGNNTIYMRPRLGKSGGNLNIEQIERSGVAMCPPFS